MRLFLIFFTAMLMSCENNSFDSDKRQLIAKDEIRKQLRNPRGFDIIGFNQDTLDTSPYTTISHPIRYSIDFVFIDSTGRVLKKKGVVLFTPDGKSVLTSNITNSGL